MKLFVRPNDNSERRKKMKKNKMMRLAALLLVMVLMTTCVIGGTFAKYTTSVTSSDSARVAYWGFQSANSMNLTGLFADTYDNVDSVNGDDVIAPGTSGSTTFKFAWDEDTTAWEGAKVNVTGPEVAYTFTVAVKETCDALIKANPNIQWKLDNGAWGTWDNMVTAIMNLSGSTDGSGVKDYTPNTLPSAFTSADNEHTISWQWIFETADAEGTDANEMDVQDVTDTDMGNAQLLDDCSIQITITATQIN